ncbi:hypothetical protein LCGC14_0843520 [marine sediment metagenome]|uniref:Uncharacterized protein n=1 Tax=marine sediment metagenome TaxID=412755 RepID=A0A0F9SJK5_9ZZZZ
MTIGVEAVRSLLDKLENGSLSLLEINQPVRELDPLKGECEPSCRYFEPGNEIIIRLKVENKNGN